MYECTCERAGGGARRDIIQIKYSWLSVLAIEHAFISRDE